MANLMGPPSLPGFSLRVQLFSPNAYATGDKPIRCFRVVTSPDCTIREFCQEASRIHEINYGHPIAIKKCQDDQEFDVTQSEIVGNLFTNTAFIRVIEAAANSSIRDSVPPNSALRYDPALNANRKREREGSMRPNGAPPTSWNPNKRQRVSDLDPDQPIPSREEELEAIQEIEGARNIVPNSQQSTENQRHVRLEVLESPTPSPPPALLCHSHSEIHSTDQQSPKSAIPDQPLSITRPSPSGAIAQAPRSTSASYHISRPNERGRSVSTAATSPLDAEPQLPQHNHVKPTDQPQLSNPILPPRVNGNPASRSPNEQSVYENIESDSEASAAALNKTKAQLKSKNSTRNRLPGLEYAKKFSTPPNRHSSRSREQNSASELPLTPNSKQREETQQADDARSARKQAAEAAEQRRREASEQRKEAEEARRKEEAIAKMRAKRDAAEKEAEEKRKAIIAKAQQIEKERVEELERKQEAERQKQEAERLKQEEQARIKAEKLQRPEREKQVRLEQQRQENERREQEEQARIGQRLEAEKIEREQAEAEAERLRQKEERGKEAAAAEEERRRKEKGKAASKGTSSSGSIESGRSRSETPIRPGARPQSSTPFIPSGRKSALKHTSSQAVSSSSPIASRTVPPEKAETIQVPNTHSRRVSFNIEETNIRPGMPAPATLPPKSAKLHEVPKEKQSTTPILPPSMGRSSRNATPLGKPRQPIVPPKTSTPQKSSSGIPPPKRNTTPQVIIHSPPAKKSTPQESVKEKPKPAARREPTPVEISSDDSGSDEDIPAEITAVKILNASLRPELKSPAHTVKPEPKSEPKQAPKTETKLAPAPEEHNEEEQDEDVEMADNVSSDRDSRSPVIFNQHTSPNPAPPLEPRVTADEAETQSATDSESEVKENKEDEESSDEEEDDDDEVEQEEEEEEDDTTAVQVPLSSPELPRLQPASQTSQPSASARKGRPSQRKIIYSSTPSPSPEAESLDTQGEIDAQLTSSMFEVHSSNSSIASQSQKPPIVKSTSNILPPSSMPASSRPRFTQGASLSSMNAARQSPAINSSQVTINGFSSRGAQKKVEDSESEEESEEESEDESSEESDDDDQERNAKDLEEQLHQAKSVPLPDSDSNSEDESSEEQSDNSDQVVQNMRDQLAAEITKVGASGGSQNPKSSQSQNSQAASNRKGGSGASQKSIPSPSVTRTYKGYGKRAGSDLLKEAKKKKDDKYLTGYQFSQYT